MACAIIGQVDVRTQHQLPVTGALRAYLPGSLGRGEGAFFIGLVGVGDHAGPAYAVREAREGKSLRTRAVCRGEMGL
jgi:hypothetical protein